MPNWCVTNYKIKGKKEDIQAFCNIVNDLPNRPDAIENGFGKYFLGNLAAALGIEIDRFTDNIRGTIDTDAGLCATLVFPESDYPKLECQDCPDGDAMTMFSTASAWDRPFWLEDYLAEKFEYGFTSTDEFGNFHVVCNTEFFPCIYEVHFEDCWEDYEIGEEEKVLKDVCDALGVQNDSKPSCPAELSSILSQYSDKLEEKEIEIIIYDIEA